MRTILQDGAPVLRQVAKPVPEKLFGSAELSSLIADMNAVLDAEEDGVALAAPQIGASYRVFIVRKDRILPPAPEGTPPAPPDTEVYINPEIIRRSRKKQEADEGCLSVRGTYGKTKRHERASVRARRADGTTFTRGGGGLLAQIFEHEIDHLDGILFTDHANELVELELTDPHGTRA